MRKFMIKSLLYILPILVAGIAITLASGARYWPSRIPVEKKAILDRSPHDISLVLGSSHAYYGINTRLISPQCYNLASYSQCFYEDFYILRYALERHSIKALILPVSYFSNHSMNVAELSLRGERLRAFDYEQAYHIPYATSIQYWADKGSLLTFFAKALIRRPSIVDFDDRGNLTGQCDQAMGDISDSIAAFDRHNINPNFDVHHPYLDSIVQLCAVHHIHLNIVVFPFTAGYNHQIAVKGAGFDSYIRSLKALTLPDYQLLDCRQMFDQDQPRYFINADHLSPCGRDSFSSYISRKVTW